MQLQDKLKLFLLQIYFGKGVQVKVREFRYWQSCQYTITQSEGLRCSVLIDKVNKVD